MPGWAVRVENLIALKGRIGLANEGFAIGQARPDLLQLEEGPKGKEGHLYCLVLGREGPIMKKHLPLRIDGGQTAARCCCF